MKRHRRQETTRGEKLEEAPAALSPEEKETKERKREKDRRKKDRIGRG